MRHCARSPNGFGYPFISNTSQWTISDDGALTDYGKH
jgi:hypothetical protein